MAKALEGLRLQYPGYAEELERRFIRRTALRIEEREYAALREDGLIGLELHATLVSEIGRRRATLERRPALDLAVRKAELIQQMPLFEDFSPSVLRRLARGLRTRYVSAGEVILQKDAPPRSVYFIANGAVEVEAAGQVHRLGRGEMFGQLSLLSRRPRRTAVRAISHGVLLVLDEARFQRLLRGSAPLRQVVRESAARRGVPADLLEGLGADEPPTLAPQRAQPQSVPARDGDDPGAEAHPVAVPPPLSGSAKKPAAPDTAPRD